MPVPFTQREIELFIVFEVRPPVPPAPSTVTFFHTLPLKVASFRSPVLVSVYATAGAPLKTVLVTDFPSAPLSKTVDFHAACGVMALLVAGPDAPRVFFAVTENV